MTTATMNEREEREAFASINTEMLKAYLRILHMSLRCLSSDADRAKNVRHEAIVSRLLDEREVKD
jgi:hypothetical protein